MAPTPARRSSWTIRARGAVLQDVGDLLLAQAEVDRHHDQAGLRGGGVDLHPLDAVVGEHGDPVALAGAEAEQAVGETARPAVPLPEIHRNSHPAVVAAMRGAVMGDADVVLTVGRRLDFQLAYGSPAAFGGARFVRIADVPGLGPSLVPTRQRVARPRSWQR